MALSQISEKVKIFFSFAFASEDKGLFDRLRTHLSPLRRQGLIDEWYDSTIIARSTVQQIIESYIGGADIIVLLISSDFLDSDRCIEVEMKYALEESKRRETPIIPVLLRPADWSGFSLEKYKHLPSDGRPVTMWENIDNAFLEVAKGIRKVVEEVGSRVASRFTSSRIRVKQPQFPIYTIPDKQNPFFTDREDILAALRDFFQSQQGTRTRTQALYGLGGMGKTLLAMEYARLHQNEYQAILWLNTASREILNSDLSSLLDQLGIFVEGGDNEQQRFAALKHWLQHHDRWFVILDDLDDFTLVDQLLPQNSKGHALLITHSEATGPFAPAISIPQMSIREAALLLLRRAKKISAQGSQDAAAEADYQLALALAQEVEGYPLALDQAGAYIEETQRSLASYLDLYRQRKGTLLGMRGRLVNDHLDPVTTTLTLTFEKVAQIDPAALQLLHLLAFLHADAIPDEMLMHAASTLDEPLRSLAADSIALDTALAILQRFSLVHRRADTTTVNIHHIVQTVLIESLAKDQQRQLATQVVHLVASSFPEAAFENWVECERYLPHAQRCDQLILDYQLAFDDAALLLQRLGMYCYKRALYPQAETYFKHALGLREQLLGLEHPDTAQTVNTLALIYREQARYAEAEALYQRALDIRQRVFGPDHAETAQSLNNLGNLYRVRADYSRAEQFLQQAISIYEKTLGPEALQTAFALGNLAIVYQKQANYFQVEPLLQRSLAIREKLLGANHPDVAQSLNALAEWYQEQGKLQQAELLLQRALAVLEETVGSMHPETASSLDALARLYDSLQEYQKAEFFYQRALAIYEQVRGPAHPDTARVLNNLAFLFRNQDQYERAESLYQRTLAIYEETLGSEHPRTARVLQNLGRIYRFQEDYEQAEPLLRRSLAIRLKNPGPEHPDTSNTLNVLAELLTAQGRYEEAESLFLQALAIRKRVFGSEHSEMALVLENYIVLLERTNRLEEAATLQQIVQSIEAQKRQ